MSIDPLVELRFSDEFKNSLRQLAKKYRSIRKDILLFVRTRAIPDRTSPQLWSGWVGEAGHKLLWLLDEQGI